jgi:GNAT superfamily N-acetyltransferase
VSVTVRPASAADEAAWRELWAGYNEFYAAELAADVTARVWSRILDPASTVNAVVAMDDAGAVVGFANYVIHPKTWSVQPVCYLEDFFVRPAARGVGAGRALIDWLVRAAEGQGWCQVYWVTRHDNAAARRLYDSYVLADDFVRYVVRVPRD